MLKTACPSPARHSAVKCSRLSTDMAAPCSPVEIARAVDTACRSRGGAYATYSCKSVSWDDVQRGTVGGGLSCWGGNITDTRLWAKDGSSLFTVRSDNWNEKLGAVPASQVALIVGSHEHEGALRPATLSAVLKDVGTYGGYIGVPKGTDLSLKSADDAEMVSIRFQTVFLPVDESALAAREFVTEAYNYQTRDASDPRNLLLLCTTQGTSVAADAPGAQKLWVHALGPDGSTVHRYWLEGERSSHKVGGAQAESAEEAAAAAARGKGTAAVIGTRQMGTRFNVLMTIQVPLVQAPPKRGLGAGGLPPWGLSLPFGGSLCGAAASPAPAACFGGGFFGAAAPMPPACPAPSSASSFGMPAASSKSFSFTPPAGAASSRRASVGPPPPPPRVGTACAARLSRGAHAGTAPRLACGSIARDVTQRASVTVVLYAAVSGGVPSEADVAAAVDDMEALYAACAAAGSRASEPGVQFANKPLTLDDMANISAKIITQPYKPPGQLVAGGGLFPM